jgi:hypothetical protein
MFRLAGFVVSSTLLASTETYDMFYDVSSELCRRNADECCERAMQARTPESRAEWLEIAVEWEKLADQYKPSNCRT